MAAGSVLALVIAAYAAWPWTSAKLADALAPSFGLVTVRVDATRPGWNAWRVRTAELRGPTWRARLMDARIEYRWRDLVDGRLVSVVLGELELVVEGGEDGGPAAPMRPAALFAALPAERLQIHTLSLQAPALDFAAHGSLALSRTSLELSLRGDRPEALRGLDLSAGLAPDGAFRLRLEPPETTADPPPRLDAEGHLAEQRVSFSGAYRLHGETLDLLSALLALPGGLAALSGQLDAVVPWPPTARESWPEVSARGTVTARWHDREGVWPAQAEARWRLADLALSGDGDLVFRAAAQRLPVHVAVDAWRLDRAEAAGTAKVRIEGVPADLAAATLNFRLSGSLATLDVDGQAGGRGWHALRALVPGLPGAATVSARAVVDAPWPLPTTPLDVAAVAAAVQASGELRGRWQSDDGVLGIDSPGAQWRWRAGVLSGEAAGTVAYDRVRVPVAVTLDATDPTALPLTIAGSWRLDGGAEAPFALRLDSERSSVTVSAEHRIRSGLLAAWAPGWPSQFDATAGTVRARAELAWAPDGLPFGKVTVGLESVDGHYDEVLASGVDGVLELSAEAGAWRLAPTRVRVRSLDAGVSLTDVGALVSWQGDRLHVEGATARLLGGRADAAPFTYDLATGDSAIAVRFEDVALAEVLALEGEHVTGTGTLRGELPVTVSAHRPAVSGGRVRAEAPGGVIRVTPALAGGVGQPGLDFALRALQNFTYSELEADVDYTADGDLTLAVRLRGRNPDIEAGRPIHYNLTVRENVPVLLESLRLQRRVTEGVERRMRN